MDTSLNIVDLIENNTILKLSPDYNNRFLQRVKETFTQTQQQLFVSSFYCYLNYHQTNDFVIDLDNIWKWLGFSQKAMAKRSLEKYFIIHNDYKVLLCRSAEQKLETRGGNNKELILLNLRTFKLFCIKAGTDKANEIHEYFIQLEGIMNDTVNEECTELKAELENQKLSIKLEKELLREKTLLEQFSENMQCVYYGIIDNTNESKEKLIKFGNSNNLQQRVEQHKKTFSNFRLVNAFKVENKQQIENAIKNSKEIIPHKRIIEVNNAKHIEILSINNLSFDRIDTILKSIITTIEYSPENYIKLLSKNKQLQNDNDILKSEIKKLKQYENMQKNTQDIIKDITEKKRRIQKQKDNFYYVDCIKYQKLLGNREDVWNSVAYKTSGGLLKQDLQINRFGKVVSKNKSEYSFNDLRPFCKKRCERI